MVHLTKPTVALTVGRLQRSQLLEYLKNSILISKEYYLYIEFRMFYLSHRNKGNSVQDSIDYALLEWDLV